MLTTTLIEDLSKGSENYWKCGIYSYFFHDEVTTIASPLN